MSLQFRREVWARYTNLGEIFIQMVFKTMSLDEISAVREKVQELSTEGL